MCKQRLSQTAVGICFLFYCLMCRTEGNNRLQKRLNVLENRYDVDRVQYRSDMQELWSQMQNVEEICNASTTNAIPIDEQVQQHFGEFTTDTIKGITEQTHQTINRFQTGLTAEKKYIRKDIELFKHTVKEEHMELTINVDEFERKMENEFKKFESKIETVAINLKDALGNTKNVCRTTIQDMGFEQMLETGMKEIRGNADNAIADLKATLFNNERKTNLKLNEVENEHFGKLRKIEENLERKIEKVEKTTSCAGGWIRHGSFCYYFNRDKRTWHSARDSCKALGGYLAEPMEDSDFMFLYVMFRSTDFWLGGSDIRNEGHWIWDHRGKTISKQNGFWGGGQPDNYRGKEDCLHWSERVQAWNDDVCTHSFHYICQR